MPAPRLANGAPLPSTATAAPNTHAARVEDVFYPSSDGKPMAENMWQGKAILNTVVDLGVAHPDALVAADILMYPEEGNNKNSIAPDVLVGLGLGTHNRSVYTVWEEGKPPDWVLEVASPSTQTKDRREKLARYAAMGVPECWLFDAKGDAYPRGTPRLQGLKLVDGEYRPLASQLVGGKRMIRSEALGLDVYADGELLRFRDPATGQIIRHHPEVKAAAARAEARADREAERAEQEAAQRKTAEARAAQEADQRKAAEARADREAIRAERETDQRKTAEARAEQEAAARSAADARVAELEAALRRSQSEQPP